VESSYEEALIVDIFNLQAQLWHIGEYFNLYIKSYPQTGHLKKVTA